MAKNTKTTTVKSSSQKTASASSTNSQAIQAEEDNSTQSKAFRFLDLPFELRLRVYEEVLSVNGILDLNPINFFNVLPKLPLLHTCRQVHDEAYRVFYSQPVYLFPTHGRFFHTKKPILARFPPRYRQAINTLAWRIGPGWGSPPKNQNTSLILGLADCTSVRTLKIFVECDPSDNVFCGYRGVGATEDTYRTFCTNILLELFEQIPSLLTIEIDAYPSVKKDSPMVLSLVRHTERAGKSVAWGPLRGWDKDVEEPGLVGLENAMASMRLSPASRIVRVEA